MDNRIDIINAEFFVCNLKEIAAGDDRVLILGNPPWATNSTLSVIGSNNLPIKINFRNLKGLEAVTGTSNFDICEPIILDAIETFKNTESTVAMSCKTSVARNLFKEISRKNNKFSEYEIMEFDGTKIFGVSAFACVFLSGCLKILYLKEFTRFMILKVKM